MISSELENLVRIGQLKRKRVNASELDGLQQSGDARLRDAANTSLSLESRFDRLAGSRCRASPPTSSC